MRSLLAGRPHRPQPAARLHLRRQALRRLCRRHPGLGAARQRRASGRAQLQVPPPARHHDRRLRGAQRAGPARAAAIAPSPISAPPRSSSIDGLVAESQNRWPSLALRYRRRQQPAVALFPGRLLLQDLHVAAERLDDLRACSSAARPASARRRRRPIPTATSKTYAHCDVLVVGGGSRGPRRRLGRRRAPARG